MVQYAASYYDAYREAQSTHWWFRGREAVLQTLLQTHIDGSDRSMVVDVGCGPGGPTAAVFPSHPILAIDMDPSVLLANRSARLRLVADVSRVPLKPRSARVLCAFDILEHLQDDVGALRNWREALAPDAMLVVTVPAYQALWSPHDDANGHCRRYRASLLRQRLEEAGFAVTTITYFNTVLLPAIAVMRWWQRLVPDRADSRSPEMDFRHRLPAGIEWCLLALFRLERHWVRRWRLPAGVAICAIARRSESGGASSAGLRNHAATR
jgi:trans-aconitate methyltransferase